LSFVFACVALKLLHVLDFTKGAQKIIEKNGAHEHMPCGKYTIEMRRWRTSVKKIILRQTTRMKFDISLNIAWASSSLSLNVLKNTKLENSI
jgi:hypothetical protein